MSMYQKKFIENRTIQNDKLYGEVKEADYAKNHKSNNPIISGEEHLGVQKMSFGGMIITTETIGTEYCNAYNIRQQAHIENKTLAHRSLCARKNEAGALLFLTIDDFLGDIDYTDLSNKELCYTVRNNIKEVIEEQLPWLVEYSREVIRDYYNVSPNSLKIKLNFILDDGKYDASIPGQKTIGGLLLNGFLKELEFYSQLSAMYKEPVGLICQVLAPNGLPCNKKWSQIDVGISFIGKRLYKEHLVNAMIRQARSDISIKVHKDVIANAMNTGNQIYYGSLPDGGGYDGYPIYIWEILYPDQLQIEDEPLIENDDFCACNKRYNSIKEHKKLIKSELHKREN